MNRKAVRAHIANTKQNISRLLELWLNLQKDKSKKAKIEYLKQLKKLLILAEIEYSLNKEKLPDDIREIENILEERIRALE